MISPKKKTYIFFRTVNCRNKFLNTIKLNKIVLFYKEEVNISNNMAKSMFCFWD